MGRSGESYSLMYFTFPTGQYVRCPGCGGIAQMPCLICYLDNNGKYPECVWDIYSNPPQQPVTRKCIKCLRSKPIIEFGLENCASLSMKMRYSVCTECRRQRCVVAACAPQQNNEDERDNDD